MADGSMIDDVEMEMEVEKREWGRTDGPLNWVGITAVIRTAVGAVAGVSLVQVEKWHDEWY